MSDVQTIVAVTSSGYWGKGETLVEAFKNANVSFSDKAIVVYGYNCTQDKLSVDGWGGIEYPKDVTSVYIGKFGLKDLVDDIELFTATRKVCEKRGFKNTYDKLGICLDTLEQERDEAEEKAYLEEKAKAEAEVKQ